jgi:hypothetical protein
LSVGPYANGPVADSDLKRLQTLQYQNSNLGRISGPLLSADLLRQGVDLAFETDLLYLKVSPAISRDPNEDGDGNPQPGPHAIGIHNDGPAYDLDVLGTSSFTNLIALTSANLANFTISSATIANAVGNITISPEQSTNPTVATPQLQVGNLNFFDRTVLNTTVDANLVLNPAGTGQVVFNTTKVNVNGNLHATGDITWDGNITFGNNNLDSVDFNSDFTSDIIPDAPDQYDLGSFNKQWQTLRTGTLVTDLITTDGLTINGIDLLTTQGKIIYVSQNGSDTNTGVHQHSTFRTIKHALSVAQAGDEVSLFPGIYVEEFPLTVPVGVNVNGISLRSTTVMPTAATNRNDAFLLNGETTVSNLTVRNFYYDSTNDTGYGFRLAPNCRVTTRSPYVQNVSVLNRGTLTDNRAILDGGNAVTILFDAILEGGTAFSTYIDELNGGPAGLSAGLGFASGDAGRGALVDGSVVHPNSKEATILFHSVTFIVPNADGITAKNGARVEWLNSFTYFANKGIYLTEGTAGFASLGLRYGAEMRSINSANVYGNYGAVADGPSTLGYLIGHNFGYVGTGADSQNDPRLVIQANEIVATNGAELYYDSMDHKGDYRVGDIFYVSQETGRVSFNAQRIDFSSQGSIVLEGVGGITIIDATGIQNSNIRIYNNNVDSLSGPVNFSAISGNTYLNTDVFVTGAMNISNNVFVDGNVFLGNDPLDLITVAPNLTETIEPRLNNTYSLGSDNGVTPKRWDVAYLGSLNIDAITQIDNNTISTLTNDYDLRFTAPGTGKIVVSSTDVQVNNELTVGGTFTVNGTTSLQDTVIRSETLTPTTTQSAQNVSGTSTPTGFFFYGWADDPGQINPTFSVIQVGWSCVQIPGSVVTAVGDGVADYNITISGGSFASGATYSFVGDILTYGPVTITQTGNVVQTGDTIIDGDLQTNNLTVTNTAYLEVPDIKFIGNAVQATTTDADIVFNGTGTAGVVLDQRLKIKDNDISNVWASATTDFQKSVQLTPNGTGNLVINSNRSVTIPYGNNTNRAMYSLGEIRQNSTSNWYQGYLPTGNVSFNNLFDSDLNTYIIPEPTPGANDNTLRFGVNGVERATITSTRLTTPKLVVDSIDMSGNTIHNNTSNLDLFITPNGTGSVNVNNILINGNEVTNQVAGAITLASTGNGYIKFGGTGAVRLPIGNDSERRATPERGEIRYNETRTYMEVFNGTIWIPAVGTLGAASLNDVMEIFDFWSLTLG